MEQVNLPDNILEIINKAVSQAVEQTKEALAIPPLEPNQTRNYFKITEALLYNYPKLKIILSSREDYINVEVRERSKSIVGMNTNPSYRSKEDILEDMQKSRESAFEKSLSEMRQLEEVLMLFQDRKEFVVIRMYYFNEDYEGNYLGADNNSTWEDISISLDEASILKDAKTARRWRNQIVNDIATCLFGMEAAILSGTYREK